MLYLKAENIEKHFGERKIFGPLSLSVADGQKIGLVGANGSGKSTLLNILAGIEAPDKGLVEHPGGQLPAMLGQEPRLEADLSVFDNVLRRAPLHSHLLGEYFKYSEGKHTDIPPERLVQQMESLGLWEVENHIKEILSRLKISGLDRPAGQLSGGQQRRTALAAALVGKPGLLLLDEPTNHLDIAMIEWLEKYLQRQQDALLLVTHDRYFLDNVCNEIWELSHGRLFRYQGNYQYYLDQKASRQEMEATELEKNRNLLRKELEWMRRQPKARGTKQKARIDAFYELQERSQAGSDDPTLALGVTAARLGKKVLELKNIGKSLGGQKLIDGFSFLFARDSRVGIAGENGTGKSTLLNIIAGRLKPDQGTMEVGDTVQMGYYTQQGLQLTQDKRAIEVITDIAEGADLGSGTLSASQLMQQFGFPPNMQYNWASRLSGGERRKLYLLSILIRKPNFLILDEPTNDLDIESLNVLQDFLANYPGAVVFVSHDRYFLDQISKETVVFEGNAHIATVFGNYTDYLHSKEAPPTAPATQKATAKAAAEKPAAASKQKLGFKEQRELEKLETELAALEARKKEVEAELASPNPDCGRLAALGDELQSIDSAIEEKELRWLELSEKA